MNKIPEQKRKFEKPIGLPLVNCFGGTQEGQENKENRDKKINVEEGYNEGARSNGSRIKARDISEQKRKSVRITGLPPVDFSRGVYKEQGQEAGKERETQDAGKRAT